MVIRKYSIIYLLVGEIFPVDLGKIPGSSNGRIGTSDMPDLGSIPNPGTRYYVFEI